MPFVAGPVHVAADVTPPIVRITLNQGNWEADDPNVSVTFTDSSASQSPTCDWRSARTIWRRPHGCRSHRLHRSRCPRSLASTSCWRRSAMWPGERVPRRERLRVPGRRHPADYDRGATRRSVHDPDRRRSYTASDDLSGVASVELWWRYSADGGATWTSWAEGPSASSSPIGFIFPSGRGDYQFYTIATDGSGNREAPPSAADAPTHYISVDEPPSLTLSGSIDLASRSFAAAGRAVMTPQLSPWIGGFSAGTRDKTTALCTR